MVNELTGVVRRHLSDSPDKEMLAYINGIGERKSAYKWRRFASDVDNAAFALCSMGISPGETVAIFSANRPEILISDFGCYYNRAITVSIYSTSSLDQVVYIVNDSKASMLMVGDRKQYEIARQAAAQCPALRHIVIYDSYVGIDADDTSSLTFENLLEIGAKAGDDIRASVEQRLEASTPDDIATFIYTSGTTGEPKGAVLPHSCFNSCFEIHRERLTMLSEADSSLSFLPLSHIFEKAWTYFCLAENIHVTINENPKEIAAAVKKVRPTLMCAVPRFWEKAYAGINDRVSHMSGMKKEMVKRAFKIGYDRNINYVRLGKKVPWLLESLYKKADSLVFKPMREAVGIDRGNIFPTAGAPVAKHIVDFFRAMDVHIVVGYGLSETTATVSCFPQIDYVIGSVGTLMPRVEVRIAPDGEIQVKGPTVMCCYFNKPEATAEAFTEDGWFRTGDAGYFDEQGALVLTERIKDLFKTSNGKYIAPQALESRLGGDRYIEQVDVVGESRKYVTALIVPAFDALKEYARNKGIAFDNTKELLTNPDIIAMMTERIEKLQKGLPSYEQIKKFTLMPKPFTIESGELTNTLKLRRRVINQHYADVIEAMYQEA